MMSVAFKLAWNNKQIIWKSQDWWKKNGPCLGVLHWAHPSLCKDIRMFGEFFVSSWDRTYHFPRGIEHRSRFAKGKKRRQTGHLHYLMFIDGCISAFVRIRFSEKFPWVSSFPWTLAWCQTISNSTNVFASGRFFAEKTAPKIQGSKIGSLSASPSCCTS